MGILPHSAFRIRDPHLPQQLDTSRISLIFRAFPMAADHCHHLRADGHGRIQRGHGILENHADFYSVDLFLAEGILHLEQIDRFVLIVKEDLA